MSNLMRCKTVRKVKCARTRGFLGGDKRPQREAEGAEAVVWGVSCGGHDAESATRRPAKRSGHIHISGFG
jgi:hypothetical protein